MENSKNFIVLNNALDFYSMTSRKIIININHIVSIKLVYTKYNKINLSYYIINLINGRNIYVNQMIGTILGLFNIVYIKNEDYEKVDSLTYINMLKI